MKTCIENHDLRKHFIKLNPLVRRFPLLFFGHGGPFIQKYKSEHYREETYRSFNLLKVKVLFN